MTLNGDKESVLLSFIFVSSQMTEIVNLTKVLPRSRPYIEIILQYCKIIENVL